MEWNAATSPNLVNFSQSIVFCILCFLSIFPCLPPGGVGGCRLVLDTQYPSDHDDSDTNWTTLVSKNEIDNLLVVFLYCNVWWRRVSFCRKKLAIMHPRSWPYWVKKYKNLYPTGVVWIEIILCKTIGIFDVVADMILLVLW